MFSSFVQLYSLEKIINVLLQLKIYWKESQESWTFDAEKINDVMKTGGIVKQTYFVKNLHTEKLKIILSTCITC